MSLEKQCPDCLAEGVTTSRPTPYPANRCYTHHRAKLAERKHSSRERNWKKTYGISAEEYRLIYEEQGGVCFICRRAKGTGKRALAVEHDHKTGMIRGLACQPCNFDVLGHARDEIAFFERAIKYLTDPPAVRAIGVRIVPNFEENQ